MQDKLQKGIGIGSVLLFLISTQLRANLSQSTAPGMTASRPTVPVAIISTLLKNSSLFIMKATISAFLPSCAITASFISI